MHDYLFTSEVVRFAFVFGVATSMMLYERRHLTTGSIVVPGYVATFAVYPLIIAATAVNAGISYLLVNKVLNRWFLLYGRSKFTVLALISIGIQTAMLKFSPSGSWLWESDIKLVVGVGYVVPALIAHDMGRQGVVKTIRSVSIASVIVVIPIGVALWLDLPGVNDLSPLVGAGQMAIDAAWIPIAVLLSAGAAWGVSHNYGFRAGGFMGAAFIAILLGDPFQVAVALILATVTYLLVTRRLMNQMILFGRRKFSAMLLVSASIAWTLLWIGNEVLNVEALERVDVGGLALTPLIVPGLLANDCQRTGPTRVITGLTLSTAFVLSTTWWIQSIAQSSHLQLGWKVLSLLSFAFIFWPQLSPSRFGATTQSRPAVTQVVAPVVAPVIAPVIAPVFVPVVAEAGPAPSFGFSISGYRSWAQLHRDAADAAEAWLTSIVGEHMQLVATQAPLQAVPSVSDPRAERLCRWRAAAKRALDGDEPLSTRPISGWSATRSVNRPGTALPRRHGAVGASTPGTPEVPTAVTDRIAAVLPRRQATDTSLVPSGSMMGSPSLLPQRTPLVGSDPTSGGRVATPNPAARVVPSDAPLGEPVASIDHVSLPSDGADATEGAASQSDTENRDSVDR